MQALDRKLLRDIVHLRGQAIAIAMIVACGIASLVTMMSAYQSLELSQMAYYDRYRFADVFVQLKRAPESLAERIGEIPGVRQVQTRVVRDVILDIPNLPEPATGRLVSIPDRPTLMLNDLFLRRGRYVEPGRSDEVMVSEAFAEANEFDIGDRVGAIVNGRWEELRIVGIALSPEYVYEIRGTDLLPDNRRFGVMWMGHEALSTAFDMDGAFNDVSLALLPGADRADVIFRLDKLLDRFGGLGAYGREDQISNRFVTDEIVSLWATAVVMPTLFLAIAAFLLNLVLARLIATQRDQIAVLKAFGYDNTSVGAHYLKLVLAIVLVGAALGTGLGLWMGSGLTRYYTNFFHFPLLRYEAGRELILSAIAVSAGAAIFGAFTAVRQAVSLPPAEAMRPEQPAQFRPTLVERLGLQRWFSPASRIILRNLERRPLQAFFSITGIAFAVAILVIGRYFIDVTDLLVDVQFRSIQREDITLAFNEALPGSARYDLTHLPGIMQVEPFRAVPARLRHDHYSHRSGLTGLEPTGNLRRLLDRDLNEVPLPPDGVVMSKKLAEMLHVTIGDTLTVEVLEGERPIRTMPVVGTVDDLLGVAAYVDINALNRLMREGPSISGAYLRADLTQSDRLFAQVKRTPAIASVALRETGIARFQETVAQSMRVFTIVLVVFACIIAFGVAYNTARIALSERSRELATLRIIGFTKEEVAFILLGEQAVLTVTAIPFGFGLGIGGSALMSLAYNTELYRLPLTIGRSTYGFSVIVIAIAAIASGWFVRRQLDRVDLVAVLKTRE
ncbi:MAG: FtsX-like permease family protein [Cyanobacteria bacterium J06642_2]